MNCVNLLTLDKEKILRKLGNLPDSAIQLVYQRMRSGLTGLCWRARRFVSAIR